MQLDLFDESQNKIFGTSDYSTFKKVLAESNCPKCALSKSRTKIVVDRGNPAAEVLMVGEAPGENEDLKGEAFVGRAGRLLDQLMQEAGFDTNRECLIVNLVKCRPPDNRLPKQEEVDACRPYLQKQFSMIRPKLVILLGATALRYLFREKADLSMKEQVGQFFTHADYEGLKFIVFYHPAYILRDPRKKPDMSEHIKIFMIEWLKVRGS
jgi:uracil-DNA glycosylase